MLPPWATKPEMLLTYVLFVLAALISVYSSDIRRFIKIILTVPPSKFRSSWKASRLLFYRTELQTLKQRRNSAYELLLYALTTVGSMACYAVALGISGLLLVVIFSNRLTGNEAPIVLILYFAAGPFMIAASVTKIFLDLRHLKSYDKRIVHLEKKIAELSGSGPPAV
jgi:hypothetical protein